ncbi:hypothetical protein D3C72_1192310 [compost metagenome]
MPLAVCSSAGWSPVACIRYSLKFQVRPSFCCDKYRPAVVVSLPLSSTKVLASLVSLRVLLASSIEVLNTTAENARPV